MRRCIVLTGFLVSLASPALGSDVIPVPSDSGATYSFVDGKPLEKKQVTVTTKRESPSGTVYTTSLVDCRKGTYASLTEATTMEQLKPNPSDAQMTPLAQGSVSYYISIYACTRLKP
jgi:hypothetical protein